MICRIKPKWLLLGTALLFYHTLVKAQNEKVSTASPGIKTFSTQADVAGAAANNVNLFTGDVTFPLNLVSLPGHNGLNVDVTLAYSSNVDKEVKLWNLETPYGITGLGWSMDLPKIISDYKQTGAHDDDEFFLSMNGTTAKLVRTTAGTDENGAYYAYETKDYQFWKIRFYYDIAEITNGATPGSGPNKWIVTTDDGTQYIYGDKNSGRKTVQYAVRWSNWMGNSARLENQTRMAIAWNLSEVVNVWKEKIIYEYEQVEQHVGSTAGLTHTEACYLKQITDVMGRKVQFFYNEKDPKYYMEPHTEQAEPDAYQEQYEKKYLDHVDVIKEDGSLFLSVQLQYTDLNPNAANGMAKMLLSSVIEKTAKGRSLPGMSFEYFNDGSLVQGYLKTMRYPTGGSVTYTYTTHQLSNSDRRRTIQAPWGYAEPKVWLGEDYVVVAWRQLNSNDTHSTGLQSVALYVYSWVGEWKEQYIGQAGACELEGGQAAFYDYKDFDVTVEKDFFAVLVRNTQSGNHSLRLVSKSNWTRGEWNSNRYDNVYGGTPTLLSGTNFVLVGSENDAVNKPSRVFNFTGDGFTPMQLTQGSGTYYYTAANNYFITHRQYSEFLTARAEIKFNYFGEDRKFYSKDLGPDEEFISGDRCNWYAANNMSLVMADDNPEFAYLWDVNYSSFFKDHTDINGNELFGELADNAPVYMLNNSLVGINGRLARYDGYYWHAETVSSLGNYHSYGDDYAIRPFEYATDFYYQGARKVFDPNTLQWQPDVVMNGTYAGNDVVNAGIDHYYFGRGYWYRKTNGVWENKVLYDKTISYFPRGGYPKLDVLVGMYPAPIEKINVFKNGEIMDYSLGDQRLLYNISTKFKSNGIGNSTIVSYPRTFSTSVFNTIEDAYVIQLNRLVGDDIDGPQLDFPVTLVTVNDGTQNRFTSIEYNNAKGRYDASGNTVQYHEVTVIPGSDNAANRPYGYTTTYFNNGLTNTELGTTDPVPSYSWLIGAAYQTRVYNSSNTLVSSNKTEYNIYTKDLLNSDGNLVFKGRYIRPTFTSSTRDGVSTYTINTYDGNTGLLRKSVSYDHNSKRDEMITTYKYFWEQYDPTRSTNILSPIIQTTKTLKTASGETAFDVLAVTWKPWNNVFAPHKTYQWKRSGSAVFDFTNWSGAGEPAADWLKLSQIDVRDVNGNVIQETKR